jgi:glutamate racemase
MSDIHPQPSSSAKGQSRPAIGVFDSGFGGLTVLRELLRTIPDARYLYLGDTARLPYGAKSAATVTRYALGSAQFLIDEGAEMIVLACNTATALALPALRAGLSVPVLGVIEPGAAAAAESVAATRVAPEQAVPTHSPDRPSKSNANSASTIVLATAATVASGAYSAALAAHGIAAYEKACPLLTPLVEEGWIDHPVTREVARIYLSEAIEAAPHARTLLLGCTHYPLIADVLRETVEQLGQRMLVLDSAAVTAAAVAAHLGYDQNALPQPAPLSADAAIFATDSVDKFARLGARFLGQPLPPVQLVDLGG